MAEPDLMLIAALVVAAFLAGFVDSIAGGGGLVTVPALLAAGLPPTAALATNKLQSSFGTLSATVYHFRRGSFALRDLVSAIGCAFVGSAAGTLLVQEIDSGILRRGLPFLLIGFAVYFLVSPSAGDQERHRRLGRNAFALLVGTGVGFYDGFFGPGTGSFFALAFVALAGQGLTRATAHAKALNFTTNFASLLFFALGGQIVWAVGLPMAVGQLLGARLGSGLVLAKGAKLVRPVLVTVSVLMSARELWEAYASWG